MPLRSLTATEARMLASGEGKVQQILDKIHSAASRGDMHITMDEPLTNHTITRLRELGYTITAKYRNISSCNHGQHYHEVSWV